jgi:hypothetical protein
MLDEMANASWEHKGGARRGRLVRLLDVYWKSKQKLVGERTWINFAKSLKGDPLGDVWAESWRQECEPREMVTAPLVQTAWYVALGSITPEVASDAVLRFTGTRPPVDPVREAAAKTRSSASRKADAEELRVKKIYVALCRGVSPEPLHQDREYPGSHSCAANARET